MSMFIRAGDLKPDDVIVLGGRDYKVHDVSKYKRQSRLWVDLCLLDGPTEVGGPLNEVNRALPADVIVTWRGTALF